MRRYSYEEIAMMVFSFLFVAAGLLGVGSGLLGFDGHVVRPGPRARFERV